MNVVLCTGVMRSGSTWSFNVARILSHLATHGTDRQVWSQYMDAEPLDDFLRSHTDYDDVAIIKAHWTGVLAKGLIEVGQIKNVCTVRDPRDCVASRQRFKDEVLEHSVELVARSYAEAMRYSDKTLFIGYERIIEEPVEVIHDIADLMMLELGEGIAEEIEQATSMDEMQVISDGTQEIDGATGLHKNHIHGGTIGRWKQELDGEQRLYVTSQLSEFIRHYEAHYG